jgi:hypothetical protein
MYIVRSALMKIKFEEETNEGIKAVIHFVLKIFNEGIDMCEKFPQGKKDSTRFFNFLTSLVTRIRNLANHETTMFPATWLTGQEEIECGVMLLVTKTAELPQEEFTVCIVNTSLDNGLNYHPSGVNNTDGKPTKNIALELCNIPGERVGNAAFWSVFKFCILILKYFYY